MFAIAVNLDITQSTQVVDTTCHIQGMENGREGTEGIGAGSLDFTHDIDHQGTGLTHTHLQIAALIART